ncbi:MAG: chromosome partitioning protein ParA, partial [Rhodothermales bacterium]
DLRAGLQNNVSEAPSMREDARRQVELSEGLSTVVDSLQQLARNIPQMSREVQRQAGEALRAMGQATEAMTERAAGQAAGHQQASMMHLNELALLLSDVMNQMMNSSGSGSGTSMQQMMQQMQQMGQQQSQLNQQIQQFLNDMQGTRLSADMQQRLQQMGAQQQAIKQQLEQLRRNPESRGQLLGDLQKIADQMEETIRDLERRNVDRNMIQRQQQILQRLLDAQRSMQQRGEENRREAREGRDLSRESPDDLPPREAAEKLRRDLIRALESGYSPDYEELIKRYFELLQKQTLDRE